MTNRVENLVSVAVFHNPNGGFTAKVTFNDGGGGQSTKETIEEALSSAVEMAVLDRKYLEEKTDHIVALAEGLSPAALRHVSDCYYRLADQAKENARVVSLPQPG